MVTRIPVMPSAAARQAFAHRRDEAEEIYVVVSGSGRIELDDEIVDLGSLDAIRIAPGVARSLKGGARILAAGAPRRRRWKDESSGTEVGRDVTPDPERLRVVPGR
jgi:mannose-6-phosphate isomerase-like protein (cupin superfamily)